MDDDTDVSVDDMLEDARSDRLTSAVGGDPLAEDNDRPSAPPSPSVPDDHPSQDTDVDPMERYQEGSSE